MCLPLVVVLSTGILVALASGERVFLKNMFWLFAIAIPLLGVFTTIILSLTLRRAVLLAVSASILWPILIFIPSLTLQPEVIIILSWMYLEALYVAAYTFTRKLGKRVWKAIRVFVKTTLKKPYREADRSCIFQDYIHPILNRRP